MIEHVLKNHHEKKRLKSIVNEEPIVVHQVIKTTSDLSARKLTSLLTATSIKL